jgi:hypothetical protein
MKLVSHLSQMAIKIITGSACIFFATTAFAQASKPNHEGWYQVELIVFARKDSTGQEHWPNNIKLRYPGDWVELKDPTTPQESADETGISTPEQSPVDLTKEPYYLLPASERSLNAEAQRLQRNSNFEVLFHNAWRQVITNEKTAKAIIINGGPSFGQHQALEGNIRLSVATYLKFQTNLWFAEYDLNVGQEVTRQWPEIPLRPNLTKSSLSTLSLDSELELERALANENAAWANGTFDPDAEASEPTDNYLTRQIILLQQERDMRSSEVHYIDHPVLGVIIKITPYSAEPAATPAE